MHRIYAVADGGPRSRVCARKTVYSPPPIGDSGNFPARVPAEWPSNISPWGGGANFPKNLLINFLAKSDNSKNSSFF